MALLFPPPRHALSPKPTFPSALRSTRQLRLCRATASAGAGVSSAPPSTSSPEKIPTLDDAGGKRGGKKRRSLKTSFEKQDICRWSAMAPSQRASFPWQQQQQPGGENEGARDQESGWNGNSTLQSIVYYFDFDYDNSNGDGGAGAGGDGGAGDGVVVGGEAAEDRDDGPRPEPSYLLGSRLVSAPWMHGEEEPIKNQLVSDEEGVDRDDASEDKLGLVDGDDEYLGSDEETLSESSEGEFSEDYAAPTVNSAMMDSVLDQNDILA